MWCRYSCILALTVLLLCACNVRDYQRKPPETQVTIVPTATRELVQETIRTTSQDSPEDVVYAFLTAYEIDQNEMLFYLSSSLLEGLPSGGVISMLQFTGSLEGFVFQSGSSGEAPNLAVVEVKILMDGVDTVRIFHLTRDSGYWFIDSIEIPGE